MIRDIIRGIGKGDASGQEHAPYPLIHESLAHLYLMSFTTYIQVKKIVKDVFIHFQFQSLLIERLKTT